MKTMSFAGSILRLLQSFLSHSYQRVTINGQTTDWLPILAGVSQVSILVSILFLIYINDLADGLESQPLKFALAVGNCRGFCQGKQCFHSNDLSKKYCQGEYFPAKYSVYNF